MQIRILPYPHIVHGTDGFCKIPGGVSVSTTDVQPGIGPSPHMYYFSIAEWSDSRSDGLSCLLKQAPGPFQDFFLKYQFSMTSCKPCKSFEFEWRFYTLSANLVKRSIRLSKWYWKTNNKKPSRPYLARSWLRIKRTARTPIPGVSSTWSWAVPLWGWTALSFLGYVSLLSHLSDFCSLFSIKKYTYSVAYSVAILREELASRILDFEVESYTFHGLYFSL